MSKKNHQFNFIRKFFIIEKKNFRKQENLIL